jgi:hypothetical protein
MRFTKVGDLEVVTQITGPTHHLLGMVLEPASTPDTPILERVSIAHPRAEVEPFDPESALCREVLAGVQEANDRLGTHFGVTRIRYCADDLSVPGVYHRLAQALVEHVDSRLGRGALLQPAFEQSDRLADQLPSSERV